MIRKRRVRRLLGVAACVGVAGGCRPASSAPQAAGAAPPQPTPSQVVLAAQRARMEGRFGDLNGLLAPGLAHAHVPVILAVDRVLANNAALQAAVARRFGQAQASAYDVSVIADSYGVFSWNVRVIRESVGRDDATVWIQEGGNVPLRTVSLRHRDGAWRIEMQRPEPRLAERLDDFALALDGIRRQIEESGRSLDDLNRAFRTRIWPLVQQIAEAADDPAQAPADPGGGR